MGARRRVRVRWTALAAASLLALAVGTPGRAGPRHPLQIELTAGPPVAAASGGADVGLRLRLAIAAGYHLFAPSPSNTDFDVVTVNVTPSAGVVDPWTWPPARKETLTVLGREAEVFLGTVLLATTLHLPPGHTQDTVVQAVVHFQACSESMCLLPMDQAARLVVPAAPAGPGPAVTAGPADAVVPSGSGEGGPSPTPGATAASPAFPGGPSPLSAGSTAGPAPPAPVAGAGGEIDRWLATRGTFATLLLIFFGGLGLNLTPCVYPMIPVTVSFFGSQAAGSLGRSLGLATCYVLGMSATYSALGVTAALTGGMLGEAVGSPAFLLFIAAVFVALALSFFGLYDIQPPAFIADRAGAREGYAGASLMGLLVGFVAAPCLAPAIVALMVHVAHVGSVTWGFFLFFILSMGLGAPFLVLATVSGLISRLPRSGMWMVSVKRFFGVLLLGAAVFYLNPLMPEAATRLFLGLLLVGFGVGAGGLEPLPQAASPADQTSFWTGSLRKTAGLAGVVCGAALLWGAMTSMGLTGGPAAAGAPPAEGIAWTTLEETIDEAPRGGRPVMIDFTDTRTCPPCVELERLTFPDPSVVGESRRFAAVRIDRWTHPRLRPLAERFGIHGFPTIVFIDSAGAVRSDLTLVGFEPAYRFLARMRQVR